MFGQVVVPLDGSGQAARALDVAVPICRASGVRLKVIAYAMSHWVGAMREEIEPQVADLDQTGVDFDVEVAVSNGPVSRELVELVERSPSTLVCMATHGRGRSEALTGSVANAFIRSSSSPALLVGPHWDGSAFDPSGELLATIDGSRTSEAVLDAVYGWARTFGSHVEIVTVLDPHGSGSVEGTDSFESAQLARLARQAEEAIGSTVDFEVLHNRHTGRAIIERITDRKVSLAAMSTHGTSGLARVATGSVTSEVIRHAPCPVLTLRPAELTED